MIRKAQIIDIPQIVLLWQISFGDSDEYIYSFLETVGREDRCFVVESEGKICSMLFLLPAMMHVNGTSRNVEYIYACATSPEHRAQGLMRELLDFTFNQAKVQSVFAQILIPASEQLSQYYKQSGFKSFFSKSNFVVDRQELASAQPLTENLIQEIIDIRTRILKSEFVVQWSEEHLKFTLKDLAKNGGKVVITEDSYILLAGENRVIEALPFSKYLTSTEEDFAMIRFCEEVDFESATRPYFNFGLD
ncbi:MAG: GNAT family N-acetyltransferase [Bacteroidales bacterium]|nr:GNAT family N-acetyltransferase [Bacteroidales bacterium]